MRIVRQGNPELAKPWWVRQDHTCRSCTAAVSLVEDDAKSGEVVEKGHNDQKDGVYVEFVCPCCGERIVSYPRRLRP